MFRILQGDGMSRAMRGGGRGRADSCPLEHAEQVAFKQWMDAQHPGIMWLAIPNGHKRAWSTGKSIKAEGGSKGFPDMFFPSLMLAIELKHRKGGSVSPDQRKWLGELAGCGYTAVVCRGADEAIKVVTEVLRVRKNEL